ncbi:hypothetical protein V8G54_017933 [Vigna mungo]|uniref:Gnk2-homologous domain-containing protein n=1 Tax=Vigna mungo TaxID=3915 RepID=A0AAQ3N800_VIGMU
MAWNLFKLIFFWITFFNLTTRKATGTDAAYNRVCSSEKNSNNSLYQTNLRTLLSSLSSNATANANGFYNNTILGTNSSDTVYGLFMCRGDLLSHACKDCVANATHTLSSDTDCSLSKSSVIWYDECMVRYSNRSFFSTMNTTSGYWMWNAANISSNSSSFISLLNNTMRATAREAANSRNKYELYPFYRVTDEAPKGLVPETKYEHTDSEYSEDPGYISHNCSNNKIDADFKSKLRTLLSDLSSNATSRYGFQTQEGTAYGLFRCRIDIPSRLCEQCIKNATDRITSECGLAYAEAVIWYNHCWLRYSDRNFFSTVETSPRFGNLNISNSSPIQSSVASELSNQLAKVANMTGNTENKFLTDDSLKLNDEQRVFILGQCSSDLSSLGCSVCLSDMIGTAIQWSSLGSVGGRVWRHWRDETTLSALDPKLKENYSNIEVMRCVQIGLLCVQEDPYARPTMVTIVSYLSSHTIEMPSPQEPTFFLNHRINPIVALELSSCQDGSSSIPSSTNAISISEFYPR